VFLDSSKLKDCLGAMMQAEEGQKTSNLELTDQVLTLMSAGHEVTGIANTE
jgi:cytochrome P450